MLGRALQALDHRFETVVKTTVVVRAPHERRHSKILETRAAIWADLEIIGDKFVRRLLQAGRRTKLGKRLRPVLV